VSALLGLATRVVPVLGSATAAAVLLPLMFVGFPIFGAWVFLRDSARQVRPLAVSACSFAAAGLVLFWTTRATGAERSAVGAMIVPELVMLPLASILGAFLGTYIPPQRRPRTVGNPPG